MSVLIKKRVVFSLKTSVLFKNKLFDISEDKKHYFCINIFAIFEFLRNTAIFTIFEYTENIELKSEWNFCKIIVPTRILIEYLIMLTKRIALVVGGTLLISNAPLEAPWAQSYKTFRRVFRRLKVL